MGVLSVYLDKVTHIKDDDFLGKSDPYVKFELEQDNMIFDKGFGDKKSSKKRDELNPVYGETFNFELPDDVGMKNLELKCKVMDDDPVGDDKVGKCTIKLEDLNLGQAPVAIDRVVDNNFFSKDARVFLKLSYRP